MFDNDPVAAPAPAPAGGGGLQAALPELPASGGHAHEGGGAGEHAEGGGAATSPGAGSGSQLNNHLKAKFDKSFRAAFLASGGLSRTGVENAGRETIRAGGRLTARAGETIASAGTGAIRNLIKAVTRIG